MFQFLKKTSARKSGPVLRAVHKPVAALRPALELLEDRMVPAALLTLPADGVLSFTAGLGTANNLVISHDSVANRYSFSDSSEVINCVTILAPVGCGTNTVSFAAAPVTSSEIHLGDMNDVGRVESIAPGDPMNLYGEDGFDTLRVIRVAAPINVYGGNDNDTFDLAGWIASCVVDPPSCDYRDGTLDTFSAPVNVFGEGGADDQVWVNDFADNQSNTYQVTSAMMRRWDPVLGWGPGIFYDNSVELLRVNAGVGHDIVNVESTSASTPVLVSLKAGGLDTLNVGSAANSLNTILGAVTVLGEWGQAGPVDLININDQGDADANEYAFGGDELNDTRGLFFRNDTSLIDFRSMAGLVLNAGDGDNFIDVSGTPTGISVTLNAGGGSDTLTGSNVTNFLSITGPDAGSMSCCGGPISFSSVENLLGGLNDTIVFSANADATLSGTIDGQDGNDTLDYSALNTSVRVNLSTGSATRVAGGAAGRVADVENVIGGSANDTLTGNEADNSLDGRGGNDAMNGGVGNDMLIGGPGNDVYLFSPAGVAENDKVLELAAGGTDRLDFSLLPAATPVTVDLMSDAAIASHAARLIQTVAAGQASNFENVTGSAGADTISGNAARNSLVGGPGSDVMRGGAGNDSLDGAAGDDRLEGGTGNDVYFFAVATAPETDTVVELAGGGIDGLDFSPLPATVPVKVRLTSPLTVASHTNRTVNTGAIFQGANVENVSGGSGNDILIGNASSNVITGRGGRDLIIGREGADALDGGTGDDILIDGTTDHDDNAAALDAIMAEWSRPIAYATRVDHLRGVAGGGLNLGFLLNAGTLDLDPAMDRLTGSAGRDWFWANAAAEAVDRVLAGLFFEFWN